ncbi:MAG: hypothetical protein ACXVB1_17995 [Pseudobdellovibrionaceae bacterium]
MDKKITNELAENEVFSSSQFDLNPACRQFKSLFFDEINGRISDLDFAISFYESLSDEKIERRYCMLYWEECALGAYDSLEGDFLDSFHRSINKRELARRELKNVDLLLNESKFQILSSNNDEHYLINEIPSMYEKLLSGRWEDFIVVEEVEAFEAKHDEHSQWGFAFLQKAYSTSEFKAIKLSEPKDKDRDSVEYKDWVTKSLQAHEQIMLEARKNAPKYIDYFNKDWLASMQIQALIWYKELLKRIKKDGAISFLTTQPENSIPKVQRKHISMKQLKRANDGYEAITLSFNNFNEVKSRIPNWSELMAYMAEHPPMGFTVTASYRGGSVSELSIEGVEKPIDREAFRKRYERYFPKPDIKSDIS